MSSCGLAWLALVFVLVPALLVGACAGGDCAECRDEKCSDLLALCEQDEGCACTAACLGEDGIPGVQGCLGTCALDERPPGFASLEECVATACPDSDECSTPDGYVPPDTTDCEGSGLSIGGGTLPDCDFDDELVFDPQGEILQLESVDKRVCARIERRNDGPGSLANTKWTLLQIQVGPLGEVALVDDPSAHCWYSSHHNFRDWAHAWTGTRHHDLEIEGIHPGARTYMLHTFEQGPFDAESCAPIADGESCIGDPIELFAVNP